MTGYYTIEPTSAYDDGVGRVEPLPFQVDIDGVSVIVDLAVTPVPNTWAWKVAGFFPDGGTVYTTVEYVAVPTGSGIIDFEDLERLNPATLGPITVPAPSGLEARVAALEAALAGAGSGTGFVTVENITNAQAFMRTVLLNGSSAAGTRSLLGAGTSSLAIGTTGTDAAPGTLSATVVSNTTAIAAKADTSTVTALSTTVAGHTTTLASKADLVGGFLDHADGEVGGPLDVFCPSDVMGTRPTPRTDRSVVWHKATAPAGGGYPNAEARDSWVIWDG